MHALLVVALLSCTFQFKKRIVNTVQCTSHLVVVLCLCMGSGCNTQLPFLAFFFRLPLFIYLFFLTTLTFKFPKIPPKKDSELFSVFS